jgi:putative DNA primase/helicase
MAKLADHVKAICGELLDPRNESMSSDEQWRYGAHGSLAVNVAGEHAGLWFDHEAKVGGSLIELIKRELDGGDIDEWLRSIGIKGVKLSNEPKPRQKRVAEYVYRDEGGKPLFRVVRWGPEKRFSQERWDQDTARFVGGNGTMRDARIVPYRLDGWLDGTDTVWIAEGEKDCERLHALGLSATTAPMGAEKWRASFNEFFDDRHIVLLADNDAAGRKHVHKIARQLLPLAQSLKIVEFPMLPAKGDVSDWLDLGHTKEGSFGGRTGQVKPSMEPGDYAYIRR